jgi:hypothetical protein
VAAVKLLAELGTRQGLRLGRCLALVTALLLVCGGAARAHYNTQIYTFTSDTCITGSCGSSPWGTVTVSQDPSSQQEIDFTVSVNSPYEFFTSGSTSQPLFAVDINLANVSFGNFSIPSVTTSTGSIPVTGYGSFPYTLNTASALSNVTTFTFTASVTSGTLTPDNIVSNGSAYTTASIMNLMSPVGNGNIAAVTAPTPEPTALGLFAVALVGLGVVRRRRPRR